MLVDLDDCWCDTAKHSARRCVVVALEQDLAKYARRRSRNLHRDFVGLELDQRIVELDPVADLFQPGADDGLGAFLLRGNDDVDHGLNIPPTRRSSP